MDRAIRSTQAIVNEIRKAVKSGTFVNTTDEEMQRALEAEPTLVAQNMMRLFSSYFKS